MSPPFVPSIFDAPGWTPAWRALVEPRWGEAEARTLAGRLAAARLAASQELPPVEIFPPADRVFAALASTPPHGVRVVICGQDPYHGPGEATGLAFSVARGVRLPPSLRNILRELAADLGPPPAAVDGPPPPADPGWPPGDDLLAPWARQGVLLLNDVLTVPAGTPGGHATLGWQPLTDAVFQGLCDLPGPRVFLLWGRLAAAKSRHLHRPEHLALTAPHPSPLSAHRGFLGSRPFSQANAWLTQHGAEPVDWRCPPGGTLF